MAPLCLHHAIEKRFFILASNMSLASNNPGQLDEKKALRKHWLFPLISNSPRKNALGQATSIRGKTGPQTAIKRLKSATRQTSGTALTTRGETSPATFASDRPRRHPHRQCTTPDQDRRSAPPGSSVGWPAAGHPGRPLADHPSAR